MSVRSNWPGLAWLIRKYVDSSIGQRTPFGMKQNDPSEKTAEFSAAKKLSLDGTTLPRHFFTDRKSTRLNSSHANISYAVLRLNKRFMGLAGVLLVPRLYGSRAVGHVYAIL